MNPIEFLYSWQAVLVAVTATGITQLVKTLIDIIWGTRAIKKAASIPPPAADGTAAPAPKPAQVGKEIRKSSLVINRLVLPITPILVGALFAVLVPARPDVIVEYVTTHEVGTTQYLIYAAWGAACGQFADYFWSKIKNVVGDMIKAKTPVENEG
jgi:hypothetical protein